ncbi:hypothetical protein CLL_A2700 [Clostridium botulinum B str. Eklund 17B (NRP)]|uniref:Uncharacterized protein n=1 Tax=Clostridium botulinum (strain Eklund 17B / Type B) TaxID=935198 RepID=B2TNT1_CLOBB|nr:hypothetical protein CLL_A2700 [Clostridium botulinum B str. Eklund 17B (NRP)]CDH91606.1 hypothetical protein CB17B2617 [Clostridium botulinum B str. Eklund 17B (NRP)]
MKDYAKNRVKEVAEFTVETKSIINSYKNIHAFKIYSV